MYKFRRIVLPPTVTLGSSSSCIAASRRRCLNAPARYSSSLPSGGLGTYTRRAPATIQTFRPDLLQSSDFIDASNTAHRSILLGPKHFPTAIWYGPKKISHIRFPENSRGFLYYHCDTGLPTTAGEIRFRLTANDDPATFERGTDLIDHRGLPWSISLLKLARDAGAVPFKKQIIKDKLVDPGLVRAIGGVLSKFDFKSKQNARVLHSVEQPVYLNIEKVQNLVRIFTLSRVGCISFPTVFADTRGRTVRHPYSGRILVRFEHSKLPQHAGSRSLVLRVSKILQPIKLTIPGYDMHVPVPREGSLLERPGRVFSVNLDNSWSSYRDINMLSSIE